MGKSDKGSHEIDDKPRPVANRLDHLLVAEDKFKVPSRYFQITKVISRRVIVFLVAMALILLSLYVVPIIGKRGKSASETVVQNELPRINDSDSIEDVVENNGADYNESIKAVNNTNPTAWDKSKLDKAYFSLLYADKVGAFSQVYTMLSMIDLARQNGLDIDDNSYGINQSKRDEIRKRADQYAKRTTKARAGGVNE